MAGLDDVKGLFQPQQFYTGFYNFCKAIVMAICLKDVYFQVRSLKLNCSKLVSQYVLPDRHLIFTLMFKRGKKSEYTLEIQSFEPPGVPVCARQNGCELAQHRKSYN